MPEGNHMSRSQGIKNMIKMKVSFTFADLFFTRGRRHTHRSREGSSEFTRKRKGDYACTNPCILLNISFQMDFDTTSVKQ